MAKYNRRGWLTIYNALCFPKNKPWSSSRKTANRRYIKCPKCGNDDIEKLCNRRLDLYECEACGEFFDFDIHCGNDSKW